MAAHQENSDDMYETIDSDESEEILTQPNITVNVGSNHYIGAEGCDTRPIGIDDMRINEGNPNNSNQDQNAQAFDHDAAMLMQSTASDTTTYCRTTQYVPHHNLLMQQNQEQERRRGASLLLLEVNADDEEEMIPERIPRILNFRQFMLQTYTTATVKDDVHDDTNCVICIEKISNGENMRILECLHSFHSSCIEVWFIKADAFTCPICRQPLGLSDYANPYMVDPSVNDYLGLAASLNTFDSSSSEPESNDEVGEAGGVSNSESAA